MQRLLVYLIHVQRLRSHVDVFHVVVVADGGGTAAETAANVAQLLVQLVARVAGAAPEEKF